MNPELLVSKQLHTLFKQGTLLHYKKGDIILRPDETPKGVYFIRKGFIRSYVITEWGDEKLIMIFSKNKIFPIFWVFDQEPITRFYEAMDSVHLYCIKRTEFISALQQNTKMLFAFTHIVSQYLEACYARIDNLEYTKASSRFCSRLLTLADKFGLEKNGQIYITAPITHKDIAASIAMSRETASREFERLKKKGIVTMKYRSIVIKDKSRLEKEISHQGEKLL